MIKFLHAADLHLDSPFSALSPEKAAARRQEQRDVIARLIEAANAYGCDAVLLAGDAFDADNAYPDTIEALRRAFAACQAQIFIAPGNHDCCRPGSAYLTEAWPENVHIFKTNRIEAVELPALGLRVYGAGFLRPYENSLLEGFTAKQDGMTNLMVLHGDALSVGSPYNAVNREQIAASGLHYLALGHIHQQSGLQKAGGTYYAWPGCAMGRGFDELGEKGVYLGTLDGGECTLEFLSLGARKYEILTVQPGDDPAAAIEAALPAGTENDIYRIVLTGESEPLPMQALYAAFAPRFFSLSLRDETVPLRDLWEGMEEDTLRGLYLRQLKEQYDRADETQRRTVALAVRLGVAAMEGREMTQW